MDVSKLEICRYVPTLELGFEWPQGKEGGILAPGSYNYGAKNRITSAREIHH